MDRTVLGDKRKAVSPPSPKQATGGPDVLHGLGLTGLKGLTPDPGSTLVLAHSTVSQAVSVLQQMSTSVDLTTTVLPHSTDLHPSTTSLPTTSSLSSSGPNFSSKRRKEGEDTRLEQFSDVASSSAPIDASQPTRPLGRVDAVAFNQYVDSLWALKNDPRFQGQTPKAQESNLYNLYEGTLSRPDLGILPVKQGLLVPDGLKYCRALRDVADTFEDRGADGRLPADRRFTTEVQDSDDCTGSIGKHSAQALSEESGNSFIRFMRRDDRASSHARFSINATPEAAVEVMSEVALKVVKRPEAFPGVGSAKIAGAERVSEKVDTVVVYVTTQNPLHISVLSQCLHDITRGKVFSHVPAPMIKVADGLGYSLQCPHLVVPDTHMPTDDPSVGKRVSSLGEYATHAVTPLMVPVSGESLPDFRSKLYARFQSFGLPIPETSQSSSASHLSEVD